MRVRFGVGERVGPLWGGLSLTPRRHFENNPQSSNLFDSRPQGCACFLAAAFVAVSVSACVFVFAMFLLAFL